MYFIFTKKLKLKLHHVYFNDFDINVKGLHNLISMNIFFTIKDHRFSS